MDVPIQEVICAGAERYDFAGRYRADWDANFRVYSVRKVWRLLQREVVAAPRCQAARRMKRMGLAGAVRDRTVKTMTKAI
jgi:hypothetical protein